MKWGPLGECRECHGPIAWARTVTGRTMPLHPGELVGGNVAVMRDTGNRLVARVVTATTPPATYETLTTHHAAMCPARQRPTAGTQLAIGDDE